MNHSDYNTPENFDSLQQRCMFYFVKTMPPFKAVKSQNATAKEQESAYLFIKSIYETLYENPALFFGNKLTPDDSYQYWWSKKSEKQGLSAKIRGTIKNINRFIETVYIIINSGNANGDKIIIENAYNDFKPGVLKKLAVFGITSKKNKDSYSFSFPENTVKGLKLLALISTENSLKSPHVIHKNTVTPFLLFSLGVFDSKVSYTAEIFRGLFKDKEIFNSIIDYFDNNGFLRLDNKDYRASIGGNNISLDYIKFYGKPEGSIGDSWKTKNFSGIKFSYDELNKDCTIVGLHIPYFREVLKNIDKMSPELRTFIAKWNKCFGCRFCVHMEKSKTKPLSFTAVNGNNICGLFTSGYTFNHFNGGEWMSAEDVIAFMDFIDELFKNKLVEIKNI
ncbi:MAG: hypothetical protein FWG44_06500 [Oscillospiraceae bacterium]|nr:hypothetical protein [Oscillospiraceae bacterium]